MTRVSRKEPTPAPYMPQRPIQPSRVVVDSNLLRSTSTVSGPSRSAATLDVKRPLPPSRGQTQPTRVTSTTATTTGSSSGAPHRVPITSMTTKSSSSTSAAAISTANAIPSTNTGPRRVPMPPPPPPAPKKETDGPKRPTSRLGVDNTISTTSHRSTAAGPVVPPAPMKKKPNSTLSSVKDRVAATSSNPPAARSRTVSKPPVPSAKASLAASAAVHPASRAGVSTTMATRSGTIGATSSSNATKPLEIAKAAASTKPTWGGRPAVSTKALAGASATQKAAPVTTRPLVRKPSTHTVVSPRIGASAAGSSRTATTAKVVQRPVTPAMVALPPSPTPEDEEAKVTELEVDDDRNKENVRPVTTNELVLDHEEESPVETSTPAVVVEDLAQIEVPDADEQEEAEHEETIQNAQFSSSTLVSDPPTPSIEPANIPIPQIATEDVFDEEEIYIQNDNDYDEEEPTSADINSNSIEDPKTPQQHNARLMAVPANNAAILSAKTPISALLSSIERGFKYDYSPITPLSPADCYLPNINGETPYSHQTHAPHIKGPMQPFNHALHAPGHNGIFGGFGVMNTRKEEELLRGDIGVVHLSEYSKQYVSASLPGLDEGRQAFTELNRS